MHIQHFFLRLSYIVFYVWTNWNTPLSTNSSSLSTFPNLLTSFFPLKLSSYLPSDHTHFPKKPISNAPVSMDLLIVQWWIFFFIFLNFYGGTCNFVDKLCHIKNSDLLVFKRQLSFSSLVLKIYQPFVFSPCTDLSAKLYFLTFPKKYIWQINN